MIKNYKERKIFILKNKTLGKEPEKQQR